MNVFVHAQILIRSLQKLRKDKDIVILSADKESCTVILNKNDFVNTLKLVTTHYAT